MGEGQIKGKRLTDTKTIHETEKQQDLLYSTGSYIPYLVTGHHGDGGAHHWLGHRAIARRGGASGSLGHRSSGTTEHRALEVDQLQSNVLVLRLESQPRRLITSSSSLMDHQQLLTMDHQQLLTMDHQQLRTMGHQQLRTMGHQQLRNMGHQQLWGGRQLGLAPEASPGRLPSGSGQPLLGSSILDTCYVLSYFSRVWLFATLWAAAHQAPLSRGLSQQEYYSGLPCPPPGDLLHTGIELASPASASLQVDSLPLSHWASPCML